MVTVLVIFSAFFIVLTPSSSIATVAKKATVPSLVEQAQLILHAKIEETWSPKQRGPHGEIYTYSRLRAIEVWHGTLKTSEVILVQLGGSIGDLRLEVHGDAQFKVGDEVVLFLTTSAEAQLPVPAGRTVNTQKVARLISLAQGAFFINRSAHQSDPHLNQKLDDIVFYTEQNTHLDLKYKAVAQDPTPLWTLSSLRTMIKGLLGAKP